MSARDDYPYHNECNSQTENMLDEIDRLRAENAQLSEMFAATTAVDIGHAVAAVRKQLAEDLRHRLGQVIPSPKEWEAQQAAKAAALAASDALDKDGQ